MKEDPRDNLIREMLDTIEGLGYVQSARIDARVWARFYRRKINKLSTHKTIDSHDYKSADHLNRRTSRRA